VCQRILELREEGLSLGQLAVLFRSSWHSNVLELELAKRNIPFQKFGGRKFIEAAHVKDVMAFLRVAVNALDEVSWGRLLPLLDGVGYVTTERVIQHVVDDAAGLEGLGSFCSLKGDAGNSIHRLYDVLLTITPSMNPGESVGTAVEFLLPLLQEKYEADFSRRINDLQTLVVIAQRYNDMEEMLTDLALEPPDRTETEIGQPDTEDDILVLSTIHSAKGLEWHSVFILWVVDGHIPSRHCLIPEEALEEERRLFYVATTRSKRELYLITPNYVRRSAFPFGGESFDFSKPSRFLVELANLDELAEQWAINFEVI